MVKYNLSIQHIQKPNTRKLLKICEIFSGGTPSTKNAKYWNGTIPWLSSGETRNNFITKTERKITLDGIKNSSTRLARKNDVVVASAGQGHTRGQVSLCLIDTYVNQSVIVLRTDTKIIHPKFLFYNLKSRYTELRKLSDAHSSRGSLPKNILITLDMVLPPLIAQEKIGKILYDLDIKIENLQKQNKILEQIAQATFKSWFVDFEPVCTKIEHRWRPDESLPGLPTYLYNLFPNHLVDSELGEIPEGWEIKALSQWASVNPESWSLTNSPKKVEYVDLASTKWGNIKCTQHFLWSDAPSRAKRILRSGDTIVGTVRPANGSYSLITTGGLTGSTGFTVLRPINPLCREFVYLAVTFPENIERLAHRADGAAYPAVRSDVVGETKVVMPYNDHDILDHFSKIVAPLLNKAESNKAESRILSVLRDALLPKLISGEIRV